MATFISDFSNLPEGRYEILGVAGEEVAESRFDECLDNFGFGTISSSYKSISELQKIVDDDEALRKPSQEKVPEFYNDLKTLIADEHSTSKHFPDSLVFHASPQVDVRERERFLFQKFTNFYSICPELIQQLSSFYKFHSASTEMERFDCIQNVPSFSQRKQIQDMFDEQLTRIIERVESSIRLLESSYQVTKTPTRIRPGLCRRSLKVLEEWYQTNFHHPYPTSEQVENLSHVSGLTTEQIKKWFGNKRSRSRNTKTLTEIAKVKRRQRLLRKNNFKL